MRFSRKARCFATWIAALGVFMAALAPTLSFALATGPASGWVSVCSAGGERIVDVDAPASRSLPSRDDGHAFGHCPYCSLHAHAMAIVPSLGAAPTPPGLSHERPQTGRDRRQALVAWSVPPSRGPPRLA